MVINNKLPNTPRLKKRVFFMEKTQELSQIRLPSLYKPPISEFEMDGGSHKGRFITFFQEDACSYLNFRLSLDDFAINDEVTDILAEIEKRNYLN